jgi:hypothetical protein
MEQALREAGIASMASLIAGVLSILAETGRVYLILRPSSDRWVGAAAVAVCLLAVVLPGAFLMRRSRRYTRIASEVKHAYISALLSSSLNPKNGGKARA